MTFKRQKMKIVKKTALQLWVKCNYSFQNFRFDELRNRSCWEERVCKCLVLQAGFSCRQLELDYMHFLFPILCFLRGGFFDFEFLGRVIQFFFYTIAPVLQLRG